MSYKQFDYDISDNEYQDQTDQGRNQQLSKQLGLQKSKENPDQSQSAFDFYGGNEEQQQPFVTNALEEQKEAVEVIQTPSRQGSRQASAKSKKSKMKAEAKKEDSSGGVRESKLSKIALKTVVAKVEEKPQIVDPVEQLLNSKRLTYQERYEQKRQAKEKRSISTDGQAPSPERISRPQQPAQQQQPAREFSTIQAPVRAASPRAEIRTSGEDEIDKETDMSNCISDIGYKNQYFKVEKLQNIQRKIKEGQTFQHTNSHINNLNDSMVDHSTYPAYYHEQITKYEGKNKKLAGIKIQASHGTNNINNMDEIEEEDDILLNQPEYHGMEEKFNETGKQGSVGMSSLGHSNKKKAQGDQRDIYVEKYGVDIQFPAFYYMDAKFVPNQCRGKDDEYIVVMAYHIIPQKQEVLNEVEHEVQTTSIDGTVHTGTFNDIYGYAKENKMTLFLQKCQGRKGVQQEYQIHLPYKEPIIQFSQSGQWFGIINGIQSQICIYDSRNIQACFEQIKNQTPMFEIDYSDLQKENDQFEKPKLLMFDRNDKYFLTVFKTKLIIYSIPQHPGEKAKQVDCYNIPHEKYEEIHDVNFVSNVNHKKGENDYECWIACKANGIQSIKIFNIKQAEEQDLRTLSYINKNGKIVVKISDDFTKVIFSNGMEHYMLNGNGQDNFPWIKDKFLRNVINHGDDFYLVTSKDYDRDVDILHSSDKNFNASFKRPIEPKSIKVYDSIIVDTDASNNKSGLMKTIMKIGESIYIDTVDIALGFRGKEEENEHIKCSIDKYYMAYGFNWPYFSYGTKLNVVVVLNAFNPNFQQRYHLPTNVSGISATFLTDTHDLYIAAETNDEHFEFFHLDLDDDNPMINGPILRYAYNQVGGEYTSVLKGFHVRGSSKKEKINLNEILIFYMLHGTDLWSWSDNGSQTVQKINDYAASNFYYLSDREFFYMETEEIEYNGKDVLNSKIYLIQSVFGSYSKTQIYQDKDQRAEILNFGIDNQKRRIIILTGIKNQKDKRDKFFTIYEIDTEKVLYQLQIKNREIIGRMKSNLYNFTDGHIYYLNQVIKIRYDLIEQRSEISEEQLFDHYSNILLLKDKTDFIQTKTPLQTATYNRLAFMIRNIVKLKPRVLRILPYLHERRIHLNRRDKIDQFYTMVNDNQERNTQKRNIYILCLNISDNKLYVYTDSGILVRRFKYSELAKKIGKPICISEDGLNMIFQQSDLSPEIFLVKMSILGLQVLKCINIKNSVDKYFSKMENDFLHQSTISFYRDFLGECKKEHYKKIVRQFSLNDNADILIRFKPKEEYIQKVLDVRNTFQHEEDEIEMLHSKKETLKNKSLIYYVKNFEDQNQEFVDDYVYFDCPDTRKDIDNQGIKDITGISMNNRYIFFWNIGSAWKLNLIDKVVTKMKIYISEKEIRTFIKKIRTGSDDSIVCIRVEQSPTEDCIIVWDVENDIEKESFDCDNNAMFFQDKIGNPYIAEKNYLVNCVQGCKIVAYNFQMKDFKMNNCTFKAQYGHRVEVQSHNFVIFRNLINLSFSYMTFVIKQNIDQNGIHQKDFQFDLQGVDYIIERQTIFTSGNLVTQQYEKLLFILRNYILIDKNLLESLHYQKPALDYKQMQIHDFKHDQNIQYKTPLHIAIEAKNTRMINLILHYMSKIDYAADYFVKDIFKQLINYQFFETYIENDPFQTSQMINKQTLCLKSKEDVEIIAIQPSQISYIDDDYFSEKFGEKQDDDDDKNDNYHTYAVKVYCVRADWIINNQHGIDFLKEMVRMKKNDLFMTNYAKIITQFLYKQFSSKIRSILLPTYIVHQTSITIYLQIVEKLRLTLFARQQQIECSSGKDKCDANIGNLLENYPNINDLSYIQNLIMWKNIFCLSQGVINIINIYFFFKQTRHLQIDGLTRLWSIVDLVIISVNICISISLFDDEMSSDERNMIPVSRMRVVEAIGILFMWFKALYYLQLIPQVAPLIDIIFVVIRDMRYFTIIYLISLIAFMQSYYILGRNQMELAGDVPPDAWNKVSTPAYASTLGAIDHVIQSSLGGFDTSEYYATEQKQNTMTIYIYPLFVCMTFVECILLLNMLIAVMSDSFLKNNEVFEATKRMQQLQFVVDNWWIDPIKDKEKIVYLVAAFSMDIDDDEDEKLDEINDNIEGLKDINLGMRSDIQNIQYMVSQIQLEQKK